MTTNHKALGVQDVMSLLDIKVSRAYSLIKKLNNELKEQGYLVIPGKVSKNYLEKRLALNYFEKAKNE
jgi:ribosomal protein L18E